MGAPPPGGYGPPGGGYGAPPGGYGGPPGGYGGPPMGGGYAKGPPGAGGLVNPQAIMERNGALVILYSFLSCGIYMFYWFYKTSEEVRDALNDQSINPGTDLLLAIVTCGLWGIYIEHRNITKLHHAQLAYNPHRQDKSTTIMILNILPFVGIPFTNLVAIYMVQEEYNRARLAMG